MAGRQIAGDNKAPKKVATAEAVTKDFVSMIKKNISFLRLNLSEKTPMTILFDDSQKIDEVKLEGEPFDKVNTSLVDSMDSEMWVDLIECPNEVFEKDLKMLRKVREEVRRQVDDNE